MRSRPALAKLLSDTTVTANLRPEPTFMGSSVETVVMPPLAGLTSDPTCSCAIPGIPSIAAVIRVKPTLIRAVSTED
jgi:hypothetical protein